MTKRTTSELAVFIERNWTFAPVLSSLTALRPDDSEEMVPKVRSGARVSPLLWPFSASYSTHGTEAPRLPGGFAAGGIATSGVSMLSALVAPSTDTSFRREVTALVGT